MSEFVNTVDSVGDEALTASIIDRSITEIACNLTTSIGDYAFCSCSNLTTANFPNATSIGESAFIQCSNLTTVNLPNLITPGRQAFLGCNKLTIVEAPNATTVSYGMFTRCSILTTVDFPNATSIGGYAFMDCPNLTMVDFPKVTMMSHDPFDGCENFTTLILRNESAVVYVSSSDMPASDSKIAKGTGYIYVPSALVDSYKASSKWSTYADQFRALEDYTVDGTVTGELDSSKI